MSKVVAQDMLNAFREDAVETLNRWSTVCVDSTRALPKQTFEGLLRCAHNLKGNSSLIGFDKLESVLHSIEDQLLLLADKVGDQIEPGLMSLLMDIERLLRDWIETLVDKDINYVPADISAVDALANYFKNNSEKQNAKPKARAANPRSEITRSTSEGNEQVRIASNKLDMLIQYIGELTLAQAIISRAKTENRLNAPEVKDAISLCDKIVLSLKLSVLDIRMLPIVSVFKKLERTALDVSVRLNKPVDFVTEGETVSVDKAVLARVFDPLMHLVRNSIDHGLETAEVRRKMGKPERGQVKITAAIEPTGLVLKFQDDGRGFDLEKIKSRARELGLLTVDKEIAENEIINFVFHPNFSTAEKVTEISGRGVGLDVVQKEITALGGSLRVQTKKGEGTTFFINVPTNLSLIDVMVIKAGKVTYAVPVQDIGEILQVSEVKFEASSVYERMIRLREQVIPVEPLSKILLPPQGHAVNYQPESTNCIVVIYLQAEKYGFLVDEVLGQQQIFVRPARGYLGELFGVTGTTVLSTGEPVVIINIKEIAEDNFVRLRKGSTIGEASV